MLSKAAKTLTGMCLGILVILSVSHAVSTKGDGPSFSFTNQPIFDLSLSAERLILSAKNFNHVRGFFVMSLMALLFFQNRRYLYTTAFVLALSFITELLQAWAPTRHARILDFIPNLMGLVAASVIFWLASQLLSKRAPQT